MRSVNSDSLSVRSPTKAISIGPSYSSCSRGSIRSIFCSQTITSCLIRADSFDQRCLGQKSVARKFLKIQAGIWALGGQTRIIVIFMLLENQLSSRNCESNEEIVDVFSDPVFETAPDVLLNKCLTSIL